MATQQRTRIKQLTGEAAQSAAAAAAATARADAAHATSLRSADADASAAARVAAAEAAAAAASDKGAEVAAQSVVLAAKVEELTDAVKVKQLVLDDQSQSLAELKV